MTFAKFAILPFAIASLAACGSDATNETQTTEAQLDRIEDQAEQSAIAAGTAEAALGLTEAQLLDAELVTADGTELGDVERVSRDASGAVTELLIEIEDSNPDRYVVIPIDGLTVRGAGDDADLQTGMTMQDLAALPDAVLAP
jgi:hypothetical protein